MELSELYIGLSEVYDTELNAPLNNVVTSNPQTKTAEFGNNIGK